MRSLACLVLALALSGPALGAAGNPTASRTLFRAKCGGCHTLAAAGTKAKIASGTAGPVLTGRHETRLRIMKALSGGGTGMMPMFVGMLTPKQLGDLVTYLVSATK